MSSLVVSAPNTADVPAADVVTEAARVVELAEAANVSLRVLGGVGVRLRCPEVASHPGLRRSYQDIDFAGRRRESRTIRKLLEQRGYVPHERFNTLRGSTRLLFFDEVNERQVDVFLGTFEMCQTLALEPRLRFLGPACTASDLLLTKLQIIELNQKDIIDAITLLLGHRAEDEDRPDAISLNYLRRVCGSEWGWYTTLIDNLTFVSEASGKLLTGSGDADVLEHRVRELIAAIETTEKTLKWRLRDRIGRRRAWYELPEEVDR